MSIETHENLQYFFREKIIQAQSERNIKLSEFAEFYLTNLLQKALSTHKIFKAKGSKKVDEPLALLFGKALNAKSNREQIEILQFVGDQSLYVSGFFADSLSRKSVDMDYYIAMGGNAYSYVASLLKDLPFHQGQIEVFEELSEKFIHLVDLISEISESTGLTSNEGLLRLYERWILTKSQRLRRKLQDQGIQPCETDLKKIH